MSFGFLQFLIWLHLLGVISLRKREELHRRKAGSGKQHQEAEEERRRRGRKAAHSKKGEGQEPRRGPELNLMLIDLVSVYFCN